MSEKSNITCPRLECQATLYAKWSGPWLCPRCGLPFHVDFDDDSEFQEEAIPIELGVYLANMTGTVPVAQEAADE